MEPLTGNPEAVLTSAIEVSVALTGFSGLVVALASRRTAVTATLVSMLIVASIAAVMFSFLPLLLANAGLADPLIWRISSSLVVVYLIAIFVYRLARR